MKCLEIPLQEHYSWSDFLELFAKKITCLNTWPLTPLYIMNIMYVTVELMKLPYFYFSFTYHYRPINFRQFMINFGRIKTFCIENQITEQPSQLAGLFIAAAIITYCHKKTNNRLIRMAISFIINQLKLLCLHDVLQCYQPLFINNHPLLLTYSLYNYQHTRVIRKEITRINTPYP